MEITKSVKDTIKVIDEYSGEADDFKLAICNSLLDSTGVNMAIITDKILSKGMIPNGFENGEGYRLFQ